MNHARLQSNLSSNKSNVHWNEIKNQLNPIEPSVKILFYTLDNVNHTKVETLKVPV